MSIYLFLYFVIIFLLFFIWLKIFKKYWQYYHWKYFFASTSFYFIWLILYFLVFTTIKEKDMLLIASRILYWLSLLWMYSMIFFVLFFNNKNNIKNQKYNIIIIVIFSLFFIFSSSTSFIVKDMIYSPELNGYYENFWFWYLIYVILYLSFPFIFWLTLYLKVKKINTIINKIRLIYISIWFLTFTFLQIFFLAILPLYNIWILQIEQILFFIPFIGLTWYSVTRYHFLDLKIWIWKIIIFLLSLFWVIILINIIKNYYLSLWKVVTESWWLSIQFWVIDLTLWIILFILIYKYLNKIFLWNTKIQQFSLKTDKLKEKIPFITNVEYLNDYLKKEFKFLFNIKYISIYIIKDHDNFELIKYFDKDKLNDIFINDIVFIKENKNKLNYNKLKAEINKDCFIVLPLYNNNKLIWIFNLWTKPFKDSFYTEEINILKKFSYFLEWHLKYIWTYSALEELNITLDKRVDIQTIEYNNLINRQKEFISVVSHEIKWPIASSIFLWDCILDDINDWNYNETYLKKEIWILIEQLVKSWKLIDKLFDVQLYDVKWIKLYIEKINLKNLINSEVKMYKKVNNDIHFNLNIEDDIWFISIDKIQLTQVIDNLLTNAVKFSKQNNKIININCFSKDKYIFLEIEDSWKWFNNIDLTNIFNKYSTWNISKTWLWMWLYLCKKIVQLHEWTIHASFSKKLWWAKFTIRLNKN